MSSRTNPLLEGQEIWQHTFKLQFNVLKKEIFHFWSYKKLIFDSRYFYSFTYSMPVSIYFVPPNDPRICTVIPFEKRLITVEVNILTHIESKSRMTFDILLKEY